MLAKLQKFRWLLKEERPQVLLAYRTLCSAPTMPYRLSALDQKLRFGLLGSRLLSFFLTNGGKALCEREFLNAQHSCTILMISKPWGQKSVLETKFVFYQRMCAHFSQTSVQEIYMEMTCLIIRRFCGAPKNLSTLPVQ